MTDDLYLIWSHEHAAWWGPEGNGYTRRLSAAGRYSHEAALFICTRAMPGDAARMKALPELPVALRDIEEMRERYDTMFPNRASEPWE